jgi:hypothetical protein
LERGYGDNFSQGQRKPPKPLPTCAQNGIVPKDKKQSDSANHSRRFPFRFVGRKTNYKALLKAPSKRCDRFGLVSRTHDSKQKGMDENYAKTKASNNMGRTLCDTSKRPISRTPIVLRAIMGNESESNGCIVVFQ